MDLANAVSRDQLSLKTTLITQVPIKQVLGNKRLPTYHWKILSKLLSRAWTSRAHDICTAILRYIVMVIDNVVHRFHILIFV